MNRVDALLALFLVPFALRGWRRGLCREGFDLIGIVGGVIVAVATAPRVVPVLTASGLSHLTAFPIALALVLIVAMVCARILGGLFARLLHAVFLGDVDRAAGVCFGALKGAACLGLLLMLLERVYPNPAMQIAIQGSMLGPPLMRVASSALEVGRGLGSAASPA